jgi:hypothetical protein
MTPMTAARITALRLMSAEFEYLISLGDHASDAEGDRMALLGGALCGFVPELLDELERLQQDRPAEPHFVKFDSQRGSA